MTAVRYSPDVEQPLDDEQDLIDQLGRTSLATQRTVARRTGTTMRGTHAKATALAKGELTIPDGLPDELAQGLFAQPSRHEVLVRFSQGPPKPLPDAASGQRGMAIKVLGVEGPHLPESRETTTQDWVLAPDQVFVNSNARTFSRSFRPGASKSPPSCGARQWLSLVWGTSVADRSAGRAPPAMTRECYVARGGDDG